MSKARTKGTEMVMPGSPASQSPKADVLGNASSSQSSSSSLSEEEWDDSDNEEEPMLNRIQEEESVFNAINRAVVRVLTVQPNDLELPVDDILHVLTAPTAPSLQPGMFEVIILLKFEMQTLNRTSDVPSRAVVRVLTVQPNNFELSSPTAPCLHPEFPSDRKVKFLSPHGSPRSPRSASPGYQSMSPHRTPSPHSGRVSTLAANTGSPCRQNSDVAWEMCDTENDNYREMIMEGMMDAQ
eukprot:gene6164-2533_t